MDKKKYRHGVIFTLTIIETSCKNDSSILTKILLFIGKQRDLAPSQIEEEYLKNSDRIAQINSDFMKPKCMSHRILEHNHAFHFLQPPFLNGILCF